MPGNFGGRTGSSVMRRLWKSPSSEQLIRLVPHASWSVDAADDTGLNGGDMAAVTCVQVVVSMIERVDMSDRGQLTQTSITACRRWSPELS